MLTLSGGILAAAVLAIATDLHGLECLLAGGAILAARHLQGFGERWFVKVEAIACNLAERKILAAFAVGAAALLIRLALLPIQPAPHPVIPDEFSHLLIADTFAHGRLTNPPHPLWPSFETIHIIPQPTYASMYFPGPALLLWLGKAIAGVPWTGVLLGTSALCGLICWALQSWFPARWALLGGVIAILKIGVVSYWMNSFWGGTFAALGGTLVLGALPRLQRKPQVGLALTTAAGLGMLAASRPYEGLAFSVPIVVRLGAWLLESRRASVRAKFWRVVFPMVAGLAVAGLALGIYSNAVTNSSSRLPYNVNQQLYGWPMTLPWTDIHEVRHDRKEFAEYYRYELEDRIAFTSPRLFPAQMALRLEQDWRFFIGPALTIPFLFIARGYRSRRLRLLYLTGAVVLFAVYLEPHFPHYMAPITVVLIAATVQGFRYLRHYRWRGACVGLRLSRAIVLILAVSVTARLAASVFSIPYQRWGGYTSWCCSNEGSVDQGAITSLLPPSGEHLIVVHYGIQHRFLEQWIYNEADIDGSRVVWARELGGDHDRKLTEYFRNRRIWRFDPDEKPWKLTPYAPGVLHQTPSTTANSAAGRRMPT